MGMNNLFFLENIEWFDRTGTEMVHRVPESGSGEIKLGAQLTVRESQAAVLFYQGKAYDAYGPGRHTLTTANIPILTKILSLPWGMSSPLRAEVYFTNMKIFPNLKWGTREPVAFRDAELGLIRLRAFGIFDVRILQPVLLINSLVGTMGEFTTGGIDDYLSQIIVSRFNDLMGENIDTVFNLPGRYDELSDKLKTRLQDDLSHYGLGLTNLFISSITPPPEVQQAIDDKSRLGVFDNLNDLIKMKAAMALEKAGSQSSEAGAGLGLGLGLMAPVMFAELFKGGPEAGDQTAAELRCPDCGGTVESHHRFCPHCGHQLIVFDQCGHCGKNLPPNAKFCPRCGQPIQMKAEPRVCPHCRLENLPGSVYCNHCGEKL